MNLARRVAKLERIEVRKGGPRLVVRFEGPGSEGLAHSSDGETDQAHRSLWSDSSRQRMGVLK